MDTTFEFHPEKGYVVMTTSGKAEVAGFIQSNHDMVAHPEWKPGMNLLLDHRQLNSNELGSEEVRKLASSGFVFKGLTRETRIATVVETRLGFGLMRMWEAYVENESPTHHRIFETPEEAAQWLETEYKAR